MRIKIREDGFLELERAGKFKSQFCAVSRNLSRCGDWCPRLREPSFGRIKGKLDRLRICGIVWYGEILDERKRPDDK